MLSKLIGWFLALSAIGKAGVVTAATIATVGAVNVANNPPPKPPIDTPPTVQGDTVEIKTETTNEAVPFETKTVDNPTLPVGTDKVTVEGVNGVRTKTWKVTYTNGVKGLSEFVKEEITIQPVKKVIAHGTYVAPAPTSVADCPNGTYVNSAGNTVCSPYSAPSAPAGATAQCRDGSYSFSQSRSGTCSHHGGVAIWL